MIILLTLALASTILHQSHFIPKVQQTCKQQVLFKSPARNAQFSTGHMLVWPPENKSGWNTLFPCDAFFPTVSKSTSWGAVKGQTASPGNSSPCVSDKNEPPRLMMAWFFRNTGLWLYLLNWSPLSSVLVVILEISSPLIRSKGLQKSLMCVMRPLIDSCDWQLARLLLSPALELALSPTSAASVPPHLTVRG